MVKHDQRLDILELENRALRSQVAFLMKHDISLHDYDIQVRNVWALKSKRERGHSKKNHDSKSDSSSPHDGSHSASESDPDLCKHNQSEVNPAKIRFENVLSCKT